MKRIKVLIVDDSALVRDILEKGLSLDKEIEVVGKAADVYSARDKIVFLEPDVLTLDVEMPRMDGVEFLRRLMPQYPLPVVMVSSMTKNGSKVTLDALDAGAVDFVLKPSVKIGAGLNEMMEELREKVKNASTIDVSRWKNSKPLKIRENQNKSSILHNSTDKVIAIGASTGGTIALTKIINEFPPDIPGTVIVQHMPPVFTKMFAEKLNQTSSVEVKEAENNDRIITGRVLIAPGGYHLEVVRSGGYYIAQILEGEKVNGHTPSVDVLFNSVAKNVGSNAIGLLLTGMGKDGAGGLLNMRNSGARTFSQDEASSVVFGMPMEAFKIGASEKQINLKDVNNSLLKTIEEMRK